MHVANRSNALVRAVRLGFRGWKTANSPIVALEGVAIYDETETLEPGQSRVVYLATNALPNVHWNPGKATRHPLACVAVSAILEGNLGWQNRAIACRDGGHGTCLALPVPRKS